jgi:putative cardiolipin synthase
VTIVGGRNIGDEYFDVGHEVMFVDLDVLAIGPVVDDVTRDFERYWTSEAARPASEVLAPIDAATVAEQRQDVARWNGDPAAQSYRFALATRPFVQELLARTLPIEWAPATMLSDDPAKVLGRAKEHQLLFTRLKALVGTPSTVLRLISPYFVPGRNGLDYLTSLARHGVHIQILTNSLEATDVAAVHAGYAKRRLPLLRAGIALFELRRDAAAPSPAKLRSGAGSMGSSGSSLHAKTFAVDDARVFVGSFNFDQRSARLNTELGFLIDSPVMAREIARSFAERIPQRAYRLSLGDSNHLQWEDGRDEQRLIVTSEPGARLWQRALVRILSLFPIEWLL